MDVSGHLDLSLSATFSCDRLYYLKTRCCNTVSSPKAFFSIFNTSMHLTLLLKDKFFAPLWIAEHTKKQTLLSQIQNNRSSCLLIDTKFTDSVPNTLQKNQLDR